ncbi:hypothetical protein CcCBS67573_g04916 [Chytriomyces confervae]|uniref:Uncharacterized protein n=1 Tax=Chytriomyces confervae TaxID=246404 RepID=A0A507FE05_9FUNG|nr:hypothetical protein CcCBS67573_g04916 [Chytriomyces confervae]
MEPSTTSTHTTTTTSPCPSTKENDAVIHPEKCANDGATHSVSSCTLSSSILVATSHESGAVLAASPRAKSLSIDKLFQRNASDLRAVAPATLELITPTHARDMRLLVCRHVLSGEESAPYSMSEKEEVDLWHFENISHLATLESRLSNTHKHLHSMSLNSFWAALVAQSPPATSSNTAQANNSIRRSRTHSEPPFPSRYHESNSFSTSSTSHSGSTSSILIQADMLLVSAEKTIVNAAGIIGLASVPKWLFSQLRHYTAPVSAQSFPSPSTAAAPSNVSSSESKDAAKLLPPLNSPATLFIRLNEFGRINQAYPITQFLGQNSQLVMNRFIMRFIYSHDLTRLCSSLAKAMREGVSEVYVRWDWRLFNERMADDTGVMSEYEESEDNGETGDEDSDLLDNPFDESDDEIVCRAATDPGTNDGIPTINVQRACDNETTGDSTTEKAPSTYDESATLDNTDQSKQQNCHTFEHKQQFPITSKRVYSLPNEYVDALQPSDDTMPYFNETHSMTLDDDPALSAYQSTQPTRRPSFVEPRMPTLAESGTSRSLNGSLLHQRESESINEEMPSRTPQLVWVRIRIAKSCMVFPKNQASSGSSIDQDHYGDEDESDSSLVCALTPIPNEDTRVWPQVGDVSDSTLGRVVDGHIAGPWVGCFSADGANVGPVGNSRRPRPGIIERVAVGVFGSVLRYALGFRWKGGDFVGRPLPRGVLKRTF